ncbi:hypothetical protein M3Y95_00097800 [Aphelenchoides besseyi]|nr:hypothetical protein M3Y95_00097800 [Aphelenchoides besseyi]
MSFQFCSDNLEYFVPIDSTNSMIPLPSWCLQHAVFDLIPSAFFFLLLPLLLIQLKYSKKSPLPEDYLTRTKMTVTLLMIVVKILILIRLLWEELGNGRQMAFVENLVPIIHILTFFVNLNVSQEFLKKGTASVGIVFCTWMLFVIFGLPEFYVWINIVVNANIGSKVNVYHCVGYLIWYLLVCLQLILHCFTIQHHTINGKPSPELQAPFPSRLLFIWFSDIVKKGKQAPLSSEDLYDLNEEMQSRYLAKRWNILWQSAYEKYKKDKEELQCFEAYTSLHTVTETTPLIKEHPTVLMRYGSHGQCTPPKAVNHLKPPSIIRRLMSIFKGQFLLATFAKIVSDGLQFVNPLLLGELITFIDDPTLPQWYGIGLALGMFVTAETRSILLNNYQNIMQKISAEIQSILSLAVYEKALKLSMVARQEKTLGEAVNLLAIDVDRITTLTVQVQQYWSSPFTIILALILLYRTIGYSAIGGVLVLIMLIPANMYIAIKTKKWQMQSMKAKDERLKLTGELLLNGIRLMKLNSWENAMIRRINEFRDKELRLIRKTQLIRTIIDVCNIGASFLVALVAFSLFTLSSSEHILTANVAFVSLTVFSQLRHPLFIMADLIGQTVQAIVSNQRLKAFLVADEIDEQAIRKDINGDYAIEMENASFSWNPNSYLPTLNSISLQIKRGSFIGVIGQIGTGKTSFLEAILGEMEKVHGLCILSGSIAYCPQRYWTQNLTLRDNIIFNKPYDPDLYQKVIEACALEADIKSLPQLDFTEIGERGITLSGGQQARVGLARALYRQPEILLLDDPFAAVDSVVGKTIFDKAIGPTSLTSSCTRILVTHSLYPLPYTDLICVLKDGQIAKTGTFQELTDDPEFLPLIQTLDRETSSNESSNDLSNNDVDEVSNGSEKKSKSLKRSKLTKTLSKTDPENSKARRLITDEFLETKRVKTQIYFVYIRSMNFILFASFAVLLISNSISSVIRSFWLSDWSDNAGSKDDVSLSVRLIVFALIGVIEIIFMYGSNVSLILGSINSSQRLHIGLLTRILHCPLWFFDTTPVGRILNRFGKDMEIVDLRLSSSVRFLIVCICNVLSTFVVISTATPLFIVIFIPLTFVYINVLTYFIPTSRQLSRLSSVSISPLYSSFSETLQGITSIRAYGYSAIFSDQFQKKLDLHIKCKFHALTSRNWLGVRLEILGNIVILSAALLSVFATRWSITGGLVGISVSYSLNMTFMLNFLVRSISDVESNIVAVERIREYSNVEQESSTTNPQLKLSRSWPTHGSITFKGYSARYREGLENCLTDINVEITSGQKFAVCGRTGSGKTSLTLALFRLLQPTAGRILIDGIDVQEIKLHDLRSRISCIGQDAVLFSGSLRFNLDPFYAHSDDQIWTALEDVHMKSFVNSLPDGLMHLISESGSNISAGQKQLFCMARALLERNKIIVFDEATANVDVQTDQLIQKTIREKFCDATILTIAHRTETILDYEKVMILDHGRLVEIDSPQHLLENNKSIFYSLVHSHQAN